MTDDVSWGLSLVGRAPALHAGGQEFDSPSLHQNLREFGLQKLVNRDLDLGLLTSVI